MALLRQEPPPILTVKQAAKEGELPSASSASDALDMADDSGTTRASASAPASASVSHRLLFSADARVASSPPPSCKEAKGAEGSKAERDDGGNSVSFEDEDEEDEADSDSNASRGRSDDDEENAGETLGEAECSVATHVEENGAAMAV